MTCLTGAAGEQACDYKKINFILIFKKSIWSPTVRIGLEIKPEIHNVSIPSTKIY